MHVTTIEETKTAARAKYAEYLQAVRTRRTKEYETLKNGYRELSKGKQVIDLISTMKNAGTDELGRPRLAIVRANAKLCWFDHCRIGNGNNWLPTFSADQRRRNRNNSVQLPLSTFSTRPAMNKTNRAIVPTIPPALMPDCDLSRFHILWEADWVQVPVDPMLLKHLGGSLYVVLAAWDLTPLEQAVLRDTVQ